MCGSASNLGALHMLDWFKRIAATAPIEEESPPFSTEDTINRWADRLGHGDGLVAMETQPTSTEEKVERLVARLGAGKRSVAMEDQPLPPDGKVEQLVTRPRAGEDVPKAKDAPPSTEERSKLLLAWPQVGETVPARDERLSYGEENVERLVALPGAGEAVVIDEEQPASGGEDAEAPSIAHHGRTPSELPRGASDMRVIVVASQKGGCGKTTLAAHLAVQAGLAGDGPAVLVDADWQGSLAEWWRARNDDALALATVNPGELTAMRKDELAANLAELRRRGFAVAIIDTPPARTAAIEQVIAVADLVLIPVRPSPHDLRAVGATVDMARRSGKPFLFVVNGATPRASITVQAVAALSEHGPVAPVILHHRIDYAASMIDGRTTVELTPSSRSAQEIADLWKCVFGRINIRAAA